MERVFWETFRVFRLIPYRLSAFFFRELREEFFHILGECFPIGDKERIFRIDDDDVPESGGHDESFFSVDETVFACKVDMRTAYDLVCEMSFRKEGVEGMPAADVIPFERRRYDEALFFRETFREYRVYRGGLDGREEFHQAFVRERPFREGFGEVVGERKKFRGVFRYPFPDCCGTKNEVPGIPEVFPGGEILFGGRPVRFFFESIDAEDAVLFGL